MIIFVPGILKPFDCSAVTVRISDSFTAASARPTRWIPIPSVTETSQVTITGFIPTGLAVFV